jgi:hypothetical protein
LESAVHDVDVGRGKPLHLKNCGRAPHGHVAVVVAQVAPAKCMCGHVDVLEGRILTSPSWAPRWAVLVDGRLTLFRARGDADAREALEMAHLTSFDVDADEGTFTLSAAGAHALVLRVAIDEPHGRDVFRMWLRRLRRAATRIPTNEFVSEELGNDDYANAVDRLATLEAEAAPAHLSICGSARATPTPRPQQRASPTPRPQQRASPTHGNQHRRRDSSETR